MSCQHCQQKNLKELRNIKNYLPELWESFKEWQERIPFPYRSDGSTVHDLEKRFESELKQISLFDVGLELGNRYRSGGENVKRESEALTNG